MANPSSEQGLGNRPSEASVTGINPGEESLNIDGVTGPDSTRIPQPMLSPNSWIRACPEKGANIVVSPVAGRSRKVPLGYYSRIVSEYINNYTAGIGIYRPLQPGEWELMTPKIAHIYGSNSGVLSLRGGVIQHVLDGTKLHMRSRAPLFKRELHQNLDSEIGDQENFGVVVRDKSAKERSQWIKIPLEGTTTSTDYKDRTKTKSFAKEYLRKFGRDGTPLIDFREGDVFDDDGTQLQQQSTNQKLRSRNLLYTTGGEDYVAIEIDEKGSLFLSTPGSEIKIDAVSTSLKQILDSLLISTTASATINSGTSLEMGARSLASFYGKTATILGPDPAPIDFAIKGTQFITTVLTPFLTLLSAHCTAGSSVPAFIAYQPMLAALGAGLVAVQAALATCLSTNVKISK